MGITRDMQKISVRLTPIEGGAGRTLTTLNSFSTGDGQDNFSLSDPDLYGNVAKKKWINDSRDNIEIEVQVGSSDEKYLDGLATKVTDFNMVVIDEQSVENKKEHTFENCNVKVSAAKTSEDLRTFTIATTKYSLK